MIEIGWMVVVLVVATLATITASSFSRPIAPVSENAKRLAALEETFSEWPDPEDVLERLEKLEEAVKSPEGANLPALVQRCNLLTKDLLAVKEVVAMHEEQVKLLRSKNSLRAMQEGQG